MNTAPLTGVPRRVPVRLVTVDSGGALVEVTEHVGCESANAQVLQVSGTCQSHVNVHVCTVMHTPLSSSLFRPPRGQLLLGTRNLLGGAPALIPLLPHLSPESSGSYGTPTAPNIGTFTFIIALASELPWGDKSRHLGVGKLLFLERFVVS